MDTLAEQGSTSLAKPEVTPPDNSSDQLSKVLRERRIRKLLESREAAPERRVYIGRERISRHANTWNSLDLSLLGKILLPLAVLTITTGALLTKLTPQDITPPRQTAQEQTILDNTLESDTDKVNFQAASFEHPTPVQAKIKSSKENYLNQSEIGFLALADVVNEKYKPIIQKAAQYIEKQTEENGNFLKVDPRMVDVMGGLIIAESSGRAKVVNSDDDRGLGQVTPAAEEDARERLDWGQVDMFDEENNLTITLTILSLLMERFQDPVLAISAYNAGPMKMQRFVEQNRDHLDVYQNPAVDYYAWVMGANEALKSVTPAQTID